jgi:hypothetical protein
MKRTFEEPNEMILCAVCSGQCNPRKGRMKILYADSGQCGGHKAGVSSQVDAIHHDVLRLQCNES